MASNSATNHATRSSNHVERRRYPRVAVMSRLRGYWIELDVIVTVREISLGGFSVLSPVPFPIGSEQSFLFSTVDGRETLALVECRHCALAPGTGGQTAYLAGLQFQPQPADNLSLIVDTLQTIASRDGNRTA